MIRYAGLTLLQGLVSSLCRSLRLQARLAEGQEQRQEENTSPRKLSVGGGENASVRPLCDLVFVHRELSFLKPVRDCLRSPDGQ